MNHDEANELLAVAALHALDAETLSEIEAHAATCPRCQNELDGYRAVAAALGNSVEELPEGLWSSISGHLWDRGDVATMPDLAVHDKPGEIVAIGTSPRSTRRRRTALGALALAAAASIVVLALSLSSAQNNVTNLQKALQSVQGSGVKRALSTPGHVMVNLTSSSHRRVAQFVLLPDGNGYLVNSSLPALASNDTYQLWGIVKGAPVSIGVMGTSPGDVMFTLNSSPPPSELAITVQKAGGSLTPSKDLVASGSVLASPA